MSENEEQEWNDLAFDMLMEAGPGKGILKGLSEKEKNSFLNVFKKEARERYINLYVLEEFITEFSFYVMGFVVGSAISENRLELLDSISEENKLH